MTQWPRSTLFLLPESLHAAQVWRTLDPSFQLRRAQRQTSHRSYYDTFDWRLYRSGFALLRDREHYELHSLHDDTLIAQVDAPGERRFWWDFPEGELRNVLHQCLEERALISLVNVKFDRQTASVVDGEGHPVAWVTVENAMPSGGSRHARVLELRAVEGQENEFDTLCRRMVRGSLSVDDGTWFELLLAYGGRQPGDYSSKLSVGLEADMTARAAAVVIFRELLKTMERNVQGLCDDVDTEFLHDFRVAVRRTRAGLAQIRRVFPARSAKHFRKEFSALGKLSNRLRDLDVYLLSKPHYHELLPEERRGALEPLFDALADERAKALRCVVSGIKAVRYRKLASDWSAFLDRMSESEKAKGVANANRPIGELANRWIRRRHREVIRLGQAIDDASPDEDLHRLRIEVKKLRYLLEFFASLYPQAAMTMLVKHLKKLQDNLGEFNDFTVQRAELRHQLTSHDYPHETETAIHLLIGQLEERQARVRKDYKRNFGSFSGPQNENRYVKLFGAGDNGHGSHEGIPGMTKKEEQNMKRIILVRHATAVKRNPAKSDFDRSLRKTGEKEARDMVKRTKELIGKPALMITSPADRALETARIFAKGLRYRIKHIEKRAELYEDLTPKTFLELVKGLDDGVDSVMIFGHDPVFTEFARFLLPDFKDAMPKCGVVVAGMDTESWSQAGPAVAKTEYRLYPSDEEDAKAVEKELRKQLGTKIEATLAQTLTDFGIDGSDYVKDQLHKASAKLAKRLATEAHPAPHPKKQKRHAGGPKERQA